MTTEYEFVFILKDQSDEILKKVQSYLDTLGGSVKNQDSWGKKQFMYPIKKQSSGAYFDWSISLDGGTLRDFRKKLDYDEDILRYLIFKN